MQIKVKQGIYTLVHAGKIDRMLHGSIGKGGKPEGGVGENASDEEKIVEYDRLGGLIHNKDGRKVVTGCFCDVKESKDKGKAVAVKEPEVKLEFIVHNAQGRAQKIILPESEGVPLEVRASEKIQKEETQRIAKAYKKTELLKLAKKHKVKVLARDKEEEIVQKLLEAGVDVE